MYIRATRTRSTSTGEAYFTHRLVRTVDFKNTVIVMTSNLGSQMIQQMSGNDYQVIKLAFDDAALAAIAEAGFDPVFGARPLKRAIQERIENPLAKAILEGRFAAKDTVKVTAKGGRIEFSRQ